MNVYDLLFSMLFNILSMYMNIRVIKLFLPVKITNGMITFPLYAGAWLFNWSVYYFINIQNCTTVSLFIGLMVVTCVIFQGYMGKKLAAVAISMASCIIVENFVWEICNRRLHLLESEAVGGFCSVILEFLIILMIEKHIRLDRYIKLSVGSYLNILFLSIGSVVLSEIISMPERSNDMVMFALGILCLMNVSTYYIYEKNSETYRKKLENAAMEKQIEMYAKQFEMITQIQENLRSVRHDMKNHISLLNSYLLNQEYAEACEYTRELCGNVEHVNEYLKTGNIGVDSILNYKLERIDKDTGCRPEIKVDVPNQTFMPDLDLNIVLGNLLDNAMEALKKTDKKYLSIELKFAKGTLYISIYNAYNGELHQEKRRIVSSKADVQNHGIGLANVERIVKKYDGMIKINRDEEIFGIDIIMYVGGVQL